MKKVFLIFGVIFLCFSCGNIDMAKKYPNMVADLDPFSVGNLDLSFDQFFSSKVKPNNVNIMFYPRENLVALEFRYELIRYRQFWDQNARKGFIAAVKQYKEDFDAKKLITKFNKSRSAYGKVQGFVEWETFKFTSTYNASPLMELGYRFRGESPYFCVLQRSAREESGINSGANLESKQINIYYTKAQSDRLAEIFDQNYLLEMAGVIKTWEDEPVSVQQSKPSGDVY